MVGQPRRGDIWWGELPGIGRRPFLVVTRSSAIAVLNNVVCAPWARTIRAIPTELYLDESDGMPSACVASFDNLTVVPKARLTERLTRLAPTQLDEMCAALRTSVAC